MANEFIARKGLVVLANGATITGSLKTQGDINSVGYNISASNFSGSFYGDGSGLTNIASTLAFSGSSGNDILNLKTEALNILGSNGITTTVTDNTITVNLPAGTVSASSQVDVRNTTGIQTIATTGSNIFKGTQTVAGNIYLSASNPLIYNNDATNALLFGFYDGSTITGPYYQIFGNNYANAAQRGGAEFVYDTRNGGDGNFHISSFDGSTWVQRFRVDNGGAEVTGSLEVTTTVTASGFKGDGSQLTNVLASQIEYANILNKPSLVSASSQIDHNATTNYVANQHIDHSTVSISAGSGLSGGGDITTSRTLTLDTSSAHFTSGVKTKLNTDGVVSSSAQIDVRNTTGIATIATTGSNTFTGVQTISNTTNSTTFADGALIVQGGIGVAKDVNISGSLNVTGVLTAVTMSTQYVTSSQYTVGVSRIVLNDDDLVRFSGISVVDSGSTYGTGSLLWDSFNNRWIYEVDDQAYNSAVIIAGPKNTGALGDEPGLVAGRIPVATGDDHIDNRPESSSIYIDFTNKKTYIEAGLYVTGSVSSSVGFSGSFYGDGSNLSGIATNLQQITNNGATTTNQLTLDGGTIIHGVLHTSGSNPDVDTGTEIVATVVTSSYSAAFFDYYISSASNYRAGTITSVWQPGTANIEFTDVSTNDIGNTSGVVMSVDLLNNLARLKATVSTDNWVVKTQVRAL